MRVGERSLTCLTQGAPGGGGTVGAQVQEARERERASQIGRQTEHMGLVCCGKMGLCTRGSGGRGEGLR